MDASSSWLDMLQRKFGSRVEDLLQNTTLEPYASQLALGMHIVRVAMEQAQCTQHMCDLSNAIAKISNESQRSRRVVTVQGSAKKRWYCTVQGCAKSCICKYYFEGGARHEVYNISEVGVLQTFSAWIHGFGELAEMHHMIEVLTNVYSRDEVENFNWHSDLSTLYEDSTDVLSWSVRSPGIFCFAPRDYTGDDTWYRELGSRDNTLADRRLRAIGAGLRGLVPLFASDLILMSGNCQEYLQHKTIKFSRLSETFQLLNAYPATLQSSKDLMPFVRVKPELGAPADRGNFTARRIRYHKAQPVR